MHASGCGECHLLPCIRQCTQSPTPKMIDVSLVVALGLLFPQVIFPIVHAQIGVEVGVMVAYAASRSRSVIP